MDIIILRSYPILVSVVAYAPLYTVSSLLELSFLLVAYFSGWRGNPKEALCSVQAEQKRRRRDDTTSTKKKLWRSCLTRLKQNLKRKKKVRTKKQELEIINRFEIQCGVACCPFLGNRKRQRRRTIKGQNITSLQDGEELYEAVGDDPAFLEVDFHLHKAKATLIRVLT